NISSFRPITVAFQLCLIEQGLLRKIHQNDLLIHKPPSHPAASLQASAEFFNYFTRTVECSVLNPLLPADRAKTIIRWIKVARKLRKFNNFQSLKAVVCALNTPPINRLKRTWSIVKRKPEFADLIEYRILLSEESNYSAYREWLKTSLTRPMIPFIG
ncbi:ras guanine nucleotide exchange factor domain-containing protein, partial [Chytridium lagenaria]